MIIGSEKYAHEEFESLSNLSGAGYQRLNMIAVMLRHIYQQWIRQYARKYGGSFTFVSFHWCDGHPFFIDSFSWDMYSLRNLSEEDIYNDFCGVFVIEDGATRNGGMVSEGYV